ncbi:hypothetical protein MSIMFI_05404 [Mycobacterium simulans]|nr:hypothetical protein MSIMFI_05404 [Mycobacterium simulans]
MIPWPGRATLFAYRRGGLACKPTPLPEEGRTREVLKYIIGTLCLFAIAFGLYPVPQTPGWT